MNLTEKSNSKGKAQDSVMISQKSSAIKLNYQRIAEKGVTLIIGIRYKEGIVLIGDTKITGGSDPMHESKIVAPVPNVNVAVGCAGFTQLAKEFNSKIQLKVNEQLSAYRLDNMRSLAGTGKNIEDIESGKINNIVLPYVYKGIDFLDDCALLTQQLASTGKIYESNPLESLVAMYLPSGQQNLDIDLILYQIDCNGFKVNVPYASVGSGTDHIGNYLEKNYHKDISLYDAILLGTFLIKFVETLEFDKRKSVGLEKGKLPQIFLLNQKHFGDYEPRQEEKDKILQEVKKRISRIQTSMHFFQGGKVKKPVWGKSKSY